VLRVIAASKLVARPPVVKFAEPINALARPSGSGRLALGKKRTETFGNGPPPAA
jgi:hypothetical protein